MPLEPGEPCLLRIELSPTSHLFKPGHRMRLDATSSSFPRWARTHARTHAHAAPNDETSNGDDLRRVLAARTNGSESAGARP